MNAKPVVPNGIDRDHVGMVLEFLRKGIREPREAPVVHPHGEVRPLAVGRADVLRIGIAFDPVLLAPRCTRRGCSGPWQPLTLLRKS